MAFLALGQATLIIVWDGDKPARLPMYQSPFPVLYVSLSDIGCYAQFHDSHIPADLDHVP